MVSILKDSWCGCSLQTNAKVIGYINLLANFINATLSILQLTRLNVYGVVILFKCPLKHHVLAELLAGVLDTMASSCMAICSILLIYSAYNNGHVRLVILYLTMSALVMLTSAVFLIRCVFITANAGVIYVAEMCFSLVCGMYLWWIVYNYYLELRAQESIRRDKTSRRLLSQQLSSSIEV